MRFGSFVVSLALAAVPVATATGSIASASSPPGEAGSRLWVPERGWVSLVEQTESAPQERWVADLGALVLFRNITVDTTLVLIEDDRGDLVFTGVDLTTGDELWSTTAELADDNIDAPLLGNVEEIGEDAIVVSAFRQDESDGAAATDSPGPEPRDDESLHELLVVDVTTGAVLWQGVEGEDCCIDLAVTPDQMIIDGTALDRATGGWSWQAEGDITTSGSTVMVSAEFGADEPGFGVIDPADGRLAWWQPGDDDEHVNRRMYLADDTVIHARDGDEAALEGYDLLTGTRRWRTPLDDLPGELDSEVLDVRAAGDGLALIRDRDFTPDGFWDGGAAMIDLRSGRVLWEIDTETDVGPAIDVGGEPIVLRRDVEGYAVLDGRSGEVRATLPCGRAQSGFTRIQPVEAGVICATAPRSDEPGQTITMWTFDGHEAWTVDVVDELFWSVTPGGFVTTRRGAAGQVELVGYTG